MEPREHWLKEPSDLAGTVGADPVGMSICDITGGWFVALYCISLNRIGLRSDIIVLDVLNSAYISLKMTTEPFF